MTHPHTVSVIVYDRHQTPNQAAWCQSQMKGGWSHGREYVTKEEPADQPYTMIMTRLCEWSFEREEDAALFKLFHG